MIERYLSMRGKELRATMVSGHPIDPNTLAGFEYRGISLGLPAFIEKLSWKIFRKTFHRASDGELVGWNVRMKQVEGEDLLAPSVPLEKKGIPRAFGHYRVTPAKGRKLPGPYEQGLLIDYGVRGGGSFKLMRDPLIAINKDDPTVLMGLSYLELGWFRFHTPSFFLLVREGPIGYLPPRP